MSVQAELAYRDNDPLWRYAVGYLCSVTGDSLVYRASADPAMPALRFRDERGEEYTDAGAFFAVRARAPGYRLGHALMRRWPAFAWLMAVLFTACQRHSRAVSWLARELFGPELRATRFERVSAVFLRLLGLTYIAAFFSFGMQVRGLVGSSGILPLPHLLSEATQAHGWQAFWRVPTLAWLYPGDLMLVTICALGVGGGVLLVSGCRRRTVLAALYVLYLSVVSAGQVFTRYQWDALLLETGFLAIFLPGSVRLVPWLFRLLVARFLFVSGSVKLLGAYGGWRSLHALDHFFMTQPLPAALAWHAAHLPEGALRFMTAAILFIELAMPLFIFLPRRLRMLTAWAVIGLQILLLVTGIYGFMPLLVVALVLFLFDDQAFSRGPLATTMPPAERDTGKVWHAVRIAAAVLIVLMSGGQVARALSGRAPARPLAALAHALAPLQIVNAYALIRDVPVHRYEIELQGSDDNHIWKTYRFAFKPGSAIPRAPWDVTAQPRLDREMALAARTGFVRNAWFLHLVMQLLHGSTPVSRLFAQVPFTAHPPRLLRAELFEYRFTDPATHARTGTWWERRFLREYLSPAMLSQSEPAHAASGTAARP